MILAKTIKNMLTELDARILRIYQSAPDVPMAELASKAGTTLAVLSRRLARLRLNGQIVAKEAIINWQILGYKVEVSLRITLDKTHQLAFDNFINDARKIQEIIEIQTFLGKVDVRLLLIAKNMDDYQKVYREKVLHLPHIMEIEPLMHIARVQNNEVLPV